MGIIDTYSVSDFTRIRILRYNSARGDLSKFDFVQFWNKVDKTAKAPQKSKEANAKAAFGVGKKSKRKWSNWKSRDKLQNMCLFDKPTYDRVLKEIPNYKACLNFYLKLLNIKSSGQHSINRIWFEIPWLIGSPCHQGKKLFPLHL